MARKAVTANTAGLEHAMHKPMSPDRGRIVGSKTALHAEIDKAVSNRFDTTDHPDQKHFSTKKHVEH